MKKNELFYIIGIIILNFITLSGVSNIITIDSKIHYALYALALVLMILKIVKSKYEKKHILYMALIGLISIYTSFKTNDFMFITNFIVMIAIVDVDVKKVIKADLIMKLIFLSLHTIIYFYDYILDYSKIVPHLFRSSTISVRHALYFTHPNTTASIIIWLIIDWIYITKNKKRAIIISTIVFTLYSIFIYSRTAIIIYIIFLLLLYLLKHKKFTKITNFLEKKLFLVMICVNCLTLFISNFMKNPLIVKLDRLLSRRLYYTNKAIQLFGFHIFGNKIGNVLINNNLIVDNFYTRAFITYGFIILVVIAFLYYCTEKKEKNVIDRAILIIFPLYLFNELFPINIARSISLLIIANIIFNNKEEIKNES